MEHNDNTPSSSGATPGDSAAGKSSQDLSDLERKLGVLNYLLHDAARILLRSSLHQFLDDIGGPDEILDALDSCRAKVERYQRLVAEFRARKWPGGQGKAT